MFYKKYWLNFIGILGIDEITSVMWNLKWVPVSNNNNNNNNNDYYYYNL